MTLKVSPLRRSRCLSHAAATASELESLQYLEEANVEETYGFRLRRSTTLRQGMDIHACARKDGVDALPFVAAALIQMYGRYGNVKEARLAFDKVVTKNVFSWNSMITAYAQNGHSQEAKQAFDEMPTALRSVVSWNALLGAYTHGKEADERQCVFRLMCLEGEKPSRATFLALLHVCCATVNEARAMHSHVVEAGMEAEVPVATALVDMYGKLGELEQAREVFESMQGKNVISWTAMLGAFVHGGGDHLQAARKHFDIMPVRNVVPWNLMLGAYVQSGQSREAVLFFRGLVLEGVQADRITFAYILVACAQLEELKLGKVVHEAMRSVPSTIWDMEVWNALLEMYGKCGKMETARKVFDEEMEQQHRCTSSVPWTLMIGNYARNGLEKEANDMLKKMSLEGMHPSEVLFISLLAVCTHRGLLEAARGYMLCMVADYDLVPALEHYMCVVDLLGRMGRLEEARQMVESMPYEPDIKVWKALLSSYKSHGDAEGAVKAAGLALDIDKGAHSPYIMLSNIFKLLRGHGS